MKTTAVRLHGANDLRMDTFELPPIKDDEILVKVVSDTICMSTYKCAILGTRHKRVHPDVKDHPAIVGHEFAGDIIQVGAKWQSQFKPGMKFTCQPALNYKGTMFSPGYSYEFCGGDATYCILPHEVMELGCLLVYEGDGYFEASLAEPMSCCIGAFHACFHTKMGSYVHEMGVKKGGRMALVAAAGPMGLGALTYAIHIENRPSLVVVTDINKERLARARKLFPLSTQRKLGVRIEFVDTSAMSDVAGEIRAMFSPEGFDDVFCFAPIADVIATSGDLLGRDGCLNFFAGPTDKNLHAPLNFYDVHYGATHVIGTTGGNTEDMKESLWMTKEGILDPAVMVTHVGGLGEVARVTLNQPKLPGGKKLIYTHIDMPLTALEDFKALGEKDARYRALAEIIEAHNGLWSAEAERYLLAHWKQD